jgi:hypothetical protein
VTAMSWLIAIAATLAVLIPLVVVRLRCANRKLNAILAEHHERMDRCPCQAIQDDDEIRHRAACPVSESWGSVETSHQGRAAVIRRHRVANDDSARLPYVPRR